jgi:hypothetical protein
MKNSETALEMCLRMLKERAEFFQPRQNEYDTGMGSGYATAAVLLEYAMQDNVEGLQRFDWYHKEEEY